MSAAHRIQELRALRARFQNRPHEDARAAQGGACYTWEDDYPELAEELATLENPDPDYSDGQAAEDAELDYLGQQEF